MLPLLRLVRFSLAPSLVADAAAGAALVGAFGASAVASAVAASLLLFVGGMALNARVDVEEDSRTRPDRPLPSGQVSKGLATLLAVGGLLGAPLLGWLLFPAERLLVGGWLLGMAVAIALYHTPLRRGPLRGPALLGSIRAANLAWGGVAAAGSALEAWPLLPCAVGYGVYVFGASLVAHQEDREVSPGPVRAGLSLACVVPFLVLGVLWAEARTVSEMRCVGVAALVLVLMLRPLVQRFRDPTALEAQPGGVGALAGQLLGRMAWLTTILAWGAGSWPAGVCAVLALLSVKLLVRWIPPT